MARLKIEEALELLEKARKILERQENPNLKSSVAYVNKSMEWARKAIANRLD